MELIFENFIIEMFEDIPCYIYDMLFSITFICIPIFFVTNILGKALIFSFKLLFYEFFFLTYCSTVFYRSRVDDIWHNFSPFWSYKAYYSGDNPSILLEIFMNIVGFIPLGFLMIASFTKLNGGM